jgi:hypothetical protein
MTANTSLQSVGEASATLASHAVRIRRFVMIRNVLAVVLFLAAVLKIIQVGSY